MTQPFMHSPSPTRVALSRRRILQVGGLVAGASALSACAPGSKSEPSSSGGTKTASDTTTMASMWSDEVPRAAMAAAIAGYASKVDLSTTPIEDYKTQIRSFLAGENPPDVLTWFAGERTRFFVEQGLIADISSVYTQNASGFAQPFKDLSTTNGKQYFLPSQWYWWGMWHRKSVFEEKGYVAPESWDDFVGLLDNMKTDGLDPITIGVRTTPWTSAGWFDYLNLRINGNEFHTSLCAGKESYIDERVVAVFDAWEEVLPYFDSNAGSYAWQEAVAPVASGKAGMYLMGRFLTDSAPEDARDDFDFFRFPIIDPAVPVTEEAPTDGYFASSKAKNPEGAVALLNYLASPDGQQPWVDDAGQIGTSPEIDPSSYTGLVQRGIQHIEGSDSLSQFYDRDTDPAMATAGMDGFVEFMANPSRKMDILRRLQDEAEQIFTS